MRVIVTGGAGFIGSNLALALEQRGARVTIVDNFSSGDPGNLSTFKGSVENKDVNDLSWDRFGRVDAVLHQAAITDTTVDDEATMMQANVEGFRKVLDYAMKFRVKCIFASSASVYGNSPAPQRESDPVSPLNVYAWSKRKAEELAAQYAQEGTIVIIGLRYFNVYGAGEKHKGKAASMIYQLAEQIRAHKRPRIFHDGNQKRDHINVDDVVTANLLALEGERSGIVNIGTGRATTFNRVIDILNQALGTAFTPEHFDNPYAFYQNHTEADVHLAKVLIGFTAKIRPEDGIPEYLSRLYQLEHQSAQRSSAKR